MHDYLQYYLQITLPHTIIIFATTNSTLETSASQTRYDDLFTLNNFKRQIVNCFRECSVFSSNNFISLLSDAQYQLYQQTDIYACKSHVSQLISSVYFRSDISSNETSPNILIKWASISFKSGHFVQQ